ncbi:MAG: hypothetical protein QM687_14395 [Ferruginibacter sp.]
MKKMLKVQHLSAFVQDPTTVVFGRTKELGNTQNNKIELVVADEVSFKTPTGKYSSPNLLGEISATLAEEIGHSGSLGHTGTKGQLGFKPDETDANILKFTPGLDGKTNVMIQGSSNGTESTMNLFQFIKIYKEVVNDTKKQ